MVATTGASDVAPVRPGEELDWQRLEAYLRLRLPQCTGPFSVLQFPRGSANLTYRIEIGDTALVVRRPPLGSRARGSHDMGREHAVLAGLSPVYSRAPRAVLHCSDESVIGAEFLVAEYRSGIVVWDEVPAALSSAADASQRIGLAVIDALVDLHEIDPEAAGLSGLGRPVGYLERQVGGWSRRWGAVAAQSELKDAEQIRNEMAEVERRLITRRPRSQRPGIVHNDLKIDNCQFRPGDPDRVYSVFDWDMTTVGDPLCDFGTLLNYWPDRTLEADDPRAFIATAATRNLELPSRSMVIERYAKASDLDLAELDWYEAFGCWKTAVILQQLYARSVRGETADPRMRQRGDMVRPLAQRALASLGAEL